MSEEINEIKNSEEKSSVNFIRAIIDADLESGKHTAIQTRFRLNPTVICTSDTQSPSA